MVGIRARIRAWLIELVREAIRLEHNGATYILKSTGAPSGNPVIKVQYSEPVLISEPTFEQMQSESIARQEKYYAPLNP